LQIYRYQGYFDGVQPLPQIHVYDKQQDIEEDEDTRYLCAGHFPASFNLAERMYLTG